VIFGAVRFALYAAIVAALTALPIAVPLIQPEVRDLRLPPLDLGFARALAFYALVAAVSAAPVAFVVGLRPPRLLTSLSSALLVVPPAHLAALALTVVWMAQRRPTPASLLTLDLLPTYVEIWLRSLLYPGAITIPVGIAAAWWWFRREGRRRPRRRAP
jgi:hypothetical protein